MQCNECNREIGEEQSYADYGGGGNEVVLCLACDARYDNVLASCPEDGQSAAQTD